MKFKVKDLVEAALLVALSIALGFIKIPLPPVGNISLSFLPLILIALRNGPIMTFIYTGGVYGIIDCLLDGWGISTYPLEYLLAIGFLFLVSLTRNYLFVKADHKYKDAIVLTIALILWTVVRLLLCSLDGYLQGWAPTFTTSLIENSVNCLVDGGVSIVLTLLVYYPLKKINIRKYYER